MKDLENIQTEEIKYHPKKKWETPEVVVIDVTSGVIAGPEGAITGGGQFVGVDS